MVWPTIFMTDCDQALDQRNRGCLSGDQDIAVPLACATQNKIPFCNQGVLGIMAQGQGLGEHRRSGRVL
jgi:hypothetical protein